MVRSWGIADYAKIDINVEDLAWHRPAEAALGVDAVGKPWAVVYQHTRATPTIEVDGMADIVGQA